MEKPAAARNVVSLDSVKRHDVEWHGIELDGRREWAGGAGRSGAIGKACGRGVPCSRCRFLHVPKAK